MAEPGVRQLIKAGAQRRSRKGLGKKVSAGEGAVGPAPAIGTGKGALALVWLIQEKQR